ncbi:urea transporter [Yersinia pekkanenii]|uniref:Urea transporter n=1 Tax=Yersinia pekkanenii TaxID=1288385 RepID=A0A0T9QNK5_9GAMM|nr:urea transporter [Yersinia pekkanenii]CNI20416.1 urea transporter [Yersinia pekkanenii]CRY64200.1 urea transporter [Yersinia pekkanenii]
MNAKTGNQSGWTQLASSNVFIEFIDTTLRGCAQVMFQNNPLTGLFFFIAIFVGAYGEGNPAVAYGCVLGTVVATLTGLTMRDRKSWRLGLYGYNGCLVGAALPTFLVATPVVWACIVLGSIVSVIVMVCIADILKTWKVAALTAPFVLTTWMILLASYAFAGLHSGGLPAPALPHPLVLEAGHTFDGTNVFLSMFNGISQVFLFSSLIAGILFVIGLAIESLWAAVFALCGALLATLTASFLDADHHSINTGLYAFSAVLTAIALGSTFNKPSWRVLAYTIVGVIFTVFVQGALNTLLSPIGIPTLTMPFVLASWLFLVPNKEVMPAHRQ